MVSVVYALIRWHGGETRSFYVATGLYALAFGNHLTSITLLPAFVYMVVVTDVKVFVQPRKIFWVLGVVLLGILQYSYLYWRLDAEFFYAELFNGRSFHNLRDYLTGGNFKEAMFAYTPFQLWSERLPLALTTLSQTFPLIGLSALGIAAQKERLHVVNFLLIYFLAHTYYAMNYNIPDIEVYFIPSILALAVLAGMGLSQFIGQAEPRAALLLLAPLALLMMNYREVDLSHRTAPQRATEAVVDTVQKDAIIMTSGYVQLQFLLYYTLGYGLEKDNLFVTNYPPGGTLVKDYLAGAAPPGVGEPPLLIAQEGKYPPPGLRIFCWQCAPIPTLQKDGFIVETTNVTGFYRLEVSADGSDE